MTNQNELVIFDTNAYRYLASGKTDKQLAKHVDRLKKLEAKNGIIALMSSIVLRELLAHVAEKNDISFTQCVQATKALYLHCGDSKAHRIIADFELQIARSFFQQTIPSKEQTAKTLGQIAYKISQDSSERTLKKFQPQLRQIREYVQNNEGNFANAIYSFIRAIDPRGTGWQIFKDDRIGRKNALEYISSEQMGLEIAFGYILLTHQLLVQEALIKPLADFELLDRAKEFVKVFNAPIQLYKEVLKRPIFSEYNVFAENRANFVWDVHLMFCVGDHQVGNAKIYFVTADKAMIIAAESAGSNLSILTYDEYQEYLSAK